MKTIYIPKGETVHYESLDTERLVVKGCLKVTYGVRAKTIAGDGVIEAQSIHAGSIRAREIDSGSVICDRLIAEQVQTPELIASECAVVSTFLASAYVKTGKLTVSVSEVDEVHADEVVNLHPKKRSLLLTLFLSSLLSLWLSLKEPREKGAQVPEPKQMDVAEAEAALDRAADSAETEAVRLQVAKTVREIMAENGLPTDDGDVELKRFVSSFLLLRDQGYTLRVVPSDVPGEATPIFDFDPQQAEKPAA